MCKRGMRRLCNAWKGLALYSATVDNVAMHIKFTKMQGAGNDFVVLDETQGEFGLNQAQYRWLADRHFGVGADQILSVRPPSSAEVDFNYVIHNADGGEVENCGNGARCFVRYVRSRGLTDKSTIRVQLAKGQIELSENAQQLVRVDMGMPSFEIADVGFEARDLSPQPVGSWQAWHLDATAGAQRQGAAGVVWPTDMQLGLVSMGNPHAVQVVGDTELSPVHAWGPWLESHPRFTRRVNAGFMQIVGRNRIKLRVYERGAGETLACGTGACAAVVAGIRWGLLDASVQAHTRGGDLIIEWAGLGHAVFMTGPATTVFEGAVEVPDFA